MLASSSSEEIASASTSCSDRSLNCRLYKKPGIIEVPTLRLMWVPADENASCRSGRARTFLQSAIGHKAAVHSRNQAGARLPRPLRGSGVGEQGVGRSRVPCY